MQTFIKKILPKLAFLPFALAIGYASVLFVNKMFLHKDLPSYLPFTQSSVAPLTESSSHSNRIQVAILLDVSGSMDGLIDQTRGQIWEMVNQLDGARFNGAQPSLEIALYAFGMDQSGPDGSYSQLLSPLTTDLDHLSALLFDLRTSGSEEYCGHLISKATRDLKWSDSPDDLKFIFIAGNESFQQGMVNFTEACMRAKKNDIIVNTIFCGEEQEGIESKWKAGAIAGGGEFMSINHNEVTRYEPSPFDDQINNLNSSLNGTYVTYNGLGTANCKRQIDQDNNANAVNKSNLTKRAITKSSKLYSNNGWDLVDACKEKGFKFSSIEKKHLPEELQGKSETEIKAYVNQKDAERTKIQKEIKELSTKRKVFLAENTVTDSTTLDKVMLRTIQKQAKGKDYKFE